MSLFSWPIALVISLFLVALRRRWSWPFGALNTLIHELSHGLVAMLTGGDFDHFKITPFDPRRHGFAQHTGGCAWIIYPAGYLGSALFGGLLLLGANRPALSRPLAMGLGLTIALLTAVFGCGCFTYLTGFAVAAILVWAFFNGSNPIATFVLNIFAFQCLLSTTVDLQQTLTQKKPPTEEERHEAYKGHDAYKMATSTFSCWLLFWFLMVLLFLTFSLSYLIWPDYTLSLLLLIWTDYIPSLLRLI